jgi:amino-acid N-acetyltransferase
MLRWGRLLLMLIERATPSDVPAVEALLTTAGLPLEGVAEAFVTGVVARDGDVLLGAAAVEPYGRAGLLRSVVVSEARRGMGLGQELVAAAEALARGEGIVELYLLTETAADWFPRLGYEVVDREVARAAVGESIEFTMVCATTGVPMRRRVG